MAVLKKEDLMTKIRGVLGEDTSDDAIALVEDISDTVDELTKASADTTKWREKYEQNDSQWRKKYTERFYSKSGTEDEGGDGTNFVDEEDNKSSQNLTYDKLFKEG